MSTLVSPLEPTADHGFSSLGLSPAILRCIDNVGFKDPTPIQKAVIPTALSGRDIIGLAQTGSGKTAAFVLPLAERLTHGKGLRGLILCPTREIALQTKKFLDLFGKDHNLNTVCVIGGMRMGTQINDIKNKPDILVATPGRLFDLMERKVVDLRAIEELVLDEADHMLDMGFLPQIQKILRALPKKRHTMMFSATMPDAIVRLTQSFLHEPVKVDILPEGKAAEGITHKIYMVDPKNRDECLLSLIKEFPENILVFARMKMDADWVARLIERNGHKVEVIHSDRSQAERGQALENFRKGSHRILVATDIAARGIDIPGISLVLNYNVPETVEDYIHRAGRTARASLEGTVATITTWLDKAMLVKIETEIGKKFERCVAPGVEPYVELNLGAAAGGRRRRR